MSHQEELKLQSFTKISHAAALVAGLVALVLTMVILIQGWSVGFWRHDDISYLSDFVFQKFLTRSSRSETKLEIIAGASVCICVHLWFKFFENLRSFESSLPNFPCLLRYFFL